MNIFTTILLNFLLNFIRWWKIASYLRININVRTKKETHAHVHEKMSFFIRLMGKNFPLQYSVSIYFVSRDLKACHSSEVNFKSNLSKNWLWQQDLPMLFHFQQHFDLNLATSRKNKLIDNLGSISFKYQKDMLYFT